ncbi:hypothetical protein I6M56_06160 [Shewanella algae]|uniref:hypothetical protein n=1 Tax=Shewanella algae TaxID=38313 RepID=UPI001AACF1A7|nr:hypothetical protein [Shewanella algae]MBO2678447.1 hypothetical protein [Shewanella algae]
MLSIASDLYSGQIFFNKRIATTVVHSPSNVATDDSLVIDQEHLRFVKNANRLGSTVKIDIRTAPKATFHAVAITGKYLKLYDANLSLPSECLQDDLDVSYQRLESIIQLSSVLFEREPGKPTEVFQAPVSKELVVQVCEGDKMMDLMWKEKILKLSVNGTFLALAGFWIYGLQESVAMFLMFCVTISALGAIGSCAIQLNKIDELKGRN